MHARVADERGADVALAGEQRERAGGTPASRSAATSSSAQAGDCSAGLSTTALPVARPAEIIPSGIASGKFHGEITATTPRGDERISLRSPGRLRAAAARELDRARA